MKNPIIYKDTLISFNSILGKVTLIIFIAILSYVFMTFQLGVLESLEYRDSHFLYWKHILTYWAVITVFIFSILWYFRWLYSITGENSQKTFELIKISNIKDSSYIFWKWYSQTLCLIVFLATTLVFSWLSLFLWWATLENIIAVYIIIWLCISYLVAVGIYIGCITQNTRVWYTVGTWLLILFIALHLYILSGKSIDLFSFYNLVEFNKQFFELSFLIILATICFLGLSIWEIKNLRTKKTSLFHPFVISLFLTIILLLNYFWYTATLHVYFLLFWLYSVNLFFLWIEKNKINLSYIINAINIFSILIIITLIQQSDKIYSFYVFVIVLIIFLVFLIIKNIFYTFHKVIQNILGVIISITLLYSIPKIISSDKQGEIINIVSVFKSQLYGNNIELVYWSYMFYVYYILGWIIIYYLSYRYRK